MNERDFFIDIFARLDTVILVKLILCEEIMEYGLNGQILS